MAVCLWLCPLPTPASPSSANIFKDYKVADIQLSPSGRYLSSIMDFNGSMNLVIIDLADRTSTAITRYPPPGKVLAVHWKSDETLVYVTSGNSAGLEEHDEWAINRHGKDNLNLYHWLPADTEGGFRGIVDWLPEVADTVLMGVAQVDRDKHSDPHYFYVKKLAVGPRGTTGGEIMAAGRDCHYVVDHDGNPRICLSREADLRRRLYYRDRVNSAWRELSAFNYEDGKMIPLAFTADNKRLYVFSNFHRDTRALFEFDPESNDLTGPLVEIAGADLIDGVFGNDGRSLIGVTYLTDRKHVYFLDEAMAALQKSTQAAFPAQHAQIQSVSDDLTRAILLVDSDQSPGQFYFYESTKHSLEKLGDRAPWIDPAQFGPQRLVKFAARDGAPLRGYLTLPPNREAKSLPLILRPSGGVGDADADGWNPEAQFFATRGYAVLRVYHRGAARPGWEFDVVSSGLPLDGMKTDLLDSIDWAVSQGIVAKDRVALYGTNFNGYLSLMAMAASPDAYRCAISYGGELNLEHLFDKISISRSLWRERSETELSFWEKLLGGHRDAALLKAQSPLYNSDKIRGPVFLAYSVNDTLIPYSDAEKMKNALTGARKTAVLLGKDREPHLFDKEQDKIDLFSQLELFVQGCNPSQ